MRTDFAAMFSTVLLSVLFAGCVDTVEPAGPAQYENPQYPSELMGYAIVSSEFTGAFDYRGRIYVMNDESNLMESFSLDDPHLNMYSTPVEKDTLLLGFRPAAFCLDRAAGTIYVEDADAYSVYRILLPDGTPELLRESQSMITSLYYADGALFICYLGPEWLVRKTDVTTGETLGEFITGWPITRTALSPDGNTLFLSNSAREFLLVVNTDTMGPGDTLHVPERTGPFLMNTAGDIVLLNQNSIHAGAYLFSGETGEELIHISTMNSYTELFLMSGTDVVIALRRSDNRVSILNSQNMIFAPSVQCIQRPKIAFATEDNQYIVVLTDIPGRVYVYSHQ